MPTDDLLLARRAARADTAAWDELIARYGSRIYGVAASFAGDPSEAEDLTQEIFLKLFRNLKRYRGDVPLAAWALRLSRNLCIDHYRHHRQRLRSETVDDTALQYVAETRDNPQKRAQARQELARVHRILGEMPEILASILILRDLQGLHYEEIGTFLDLPSGTVKSRLNRARRELTRRLEDDLKPNWTDPAAIREPVSA